jgi:DNA polymerase/3'-5' exonuclease PolX
VPIQNPDVAEIFETATDLLEIEGGGRCKIEAYLDVARTCVGGHSRTATSARG